MTAQDDDGARVKVENLHAFLAERRLEVVRAEWSPHYSYPVLFVRKVAPPALPAAPLAECAACGHAQAVHENNANECFAWDCPCEIFCPPLKGAAQ